jgi:PIN domain nuclease of toxin-antitoxin system
LVERKRIQIDRHWKLWFRHFVEKNGWEVVPVDLPVIEESYSLPGPFHTDPVDRILVATTRLFDARILTADEKIRAYPHVRSEW